MGRMMLVATLAAVGMMAARAEDKAEDKAGDTSKLVGTWTVSACEKDGKREAAADLKGKTVKITRDTITCVDGDAKTEMACTYTIDTTSRPWAVTMKGTKGDHEGKTFKGIVRLDGDTLRICHAKPDQDAPENFKAKDGQCCLTLERAKK